MMKNIALWMMAFCLCTVLSGCVETSAPDTEEETVSSVETSAGNVATPDETVPVIEVVEEGMTPVYADALNDGNYEIEVKSSSSMFNITACTLHVQDGTMTADMTMSGTGYLYLFMGTGEEAAATQNDYIPFSETDGVHTFTIPVEALDAGISCAAFSKKKETWYDRTLLFRADSLPEEAFREGRFATVESLGLADGEYSVEVTLEGGSGRASVQSPARLTVSDGTATAEIIWGSNSYDYMIVDGQKFEPISMEEVSVFEIPVIGFDFQMPVSADTIAMSTPHEIEYTLYFDSASIAQ